MCVSPRVRQADHHQPVLSALVAYDHHQPVLSALVAYGSLSRARTQLSSVAYDGIGSCMRPVVCWPIRWLIRWEDTSP